MTQHDAPPDAVALAQMIADGEATAAELTQAAIDRAAQVNGDINAVILPRYEAAVREAASVDERRAAGRVGREAAGRFAGVPFLTKDLGCETAGEPTHMGNVALRDANFTAKTTAHLATMFDQLGFVNLGRTNVPEFGLTATTEPEAHGKTRNPWSLEHSAGGSSGGSAAAVAAGIVPVAHANDAGGSIRMPAANCGLFGLKGSRGRVSLGPTIGEGWGGAHVEGVVSRTVRDTAAVLDGISRPWPGDPYWAPPPETPFTQVISEPPPVLRIGLCPQSGWGGTHPECVMAVEDAGRLLEGLGHEVSVSAPDDLFADDFLYWLRQVMSVATAASFDRIGEQLGRPLERSDVAGDVWALVEMGRRVSGVDYARAVDWWHAYTRQMLTWWNDFDLLVTPVLSEPPPRLGELRDPQTGSKRLDALMHFTAQFNVTGQPAMSVPLHTSADGLPVGVQFVGSQNAEATLLALAAQLEQAKPWAARTPAVWADPLLASRATG